MGKFLHSLVLFLRMTSFWASWRPNQKNPLGYIMGLWYRVVKGRTHNFVYIEKKCRLMGKKIGKILPSLVLFFGLTAASRHNGGPIKNPSGYILRLWCREVYKENPQSRRFSILLKKKKCQ